MTGVVNLTDAQLEMIRTEPKGEVEMEIAITDEAEINPVIVKVTAAWIPKG